MAKELSPQSREDLDTPEVSAEGIGRALYKLVLQADLIEAHQENIIDSITKDHAEKSRQGERRAQAAFDLAVETLDLAIPRQEGSWAEEVEKLRLERNTQPSSDQMTPEDTQPTWKSEPEYME